MMSSPATIDFRIHFMGRLLCGAPLRLRCWSVLPRRVRDTNADLLLEGESSRIQRSFPLDSVPEHWTLDPFASLAAPGSMLQTGVMRTGSAQEAAAALSRPERRSRVALRGSVTVNVAPPSGFSR